MIILMKTKQFTSEVKPLIFFFFYNFCIYLHSYLCIIKLNWLRFVAEIWAQLKVQNVIKIICLKIHIFKVNIGENKSYFLNKCM